MPNKIERMGIKGYWTKPSIDTKGAFGSCKMFSGKGKCIQTVWLSRKSFSGKSIPVFGSSKHFTEIVLRKINSGVWFVQTFYGKYLTEIVLRKIISGVWFVDHFTENMKCVTNSSTCII